VQGARFGSGVVLTQDERLKAGVAEAVHVEVVGTSLLIVCDTDLAENQVALALDFTGCRKAHFVEPGMLRNLFCAFSKDSGEDIGTGIITSIDWTSLRADALCTAVAPSPVRILKLGSMRVDNEGRELGELRPWQV
jgi:polynucleotide 5'-kinase involved in rRNA processing